MKTGSEYKGEWGDTVLVLRAIEAFDAVYFIDELLFVDKLSFKEFADRYKPSGRVNIALKYLFNEVNFEREGNDIKGSRVAAS